MFNIHNLTVAFSGEELFSEISFRLTATDRIGLVGKNGAGKSTLLKVLSGDLESTSGEIAKEKGVRVGMLRQDIDFNLDKTVLEEAYSAFENIQSIEKQLQQITTALAERTDYESEEYHQLMVDINDLQHRYEILGGYTYQGKTEQILKGLGFKEEDFNKMTHSFSGGWRMRIELAKLLLQENEVILLDEPTNHLDIESIIWLESYLKTYQGCVVIVSHDKMFLDQVTNRTIEIILGKIYDYNKPYSEYLKLREERKAHQLAAQKNQQKEIEHTEKLIEKFRAKASKATMAQSLIKKLNKMDRIEVDEEDNTVMSIRFPISVNPGKVIFELENISKHYGEKTVLSGIDLKVDRNSKIAFVGQNGQGKSTLAKILVGEISHKGDLKRGHNVQIGYFAQNQAEYLDGNKTVLDTMIDAANEKTRRKVRDILGAFLFRGEEVDKYVKVLSGGERNRLALAKLLLQPFNVLIMDEPTNHLDIQSKNVLKEALKNYEGTLILVSHDRDFLQGLTSTVYEFRDHQLNEFLGDIDFYLEQHQLEDMREVEKRSLAQPSSSTKKKKKNKLDYKQQKKLKKLKNKLSNIEKEIGILETKIETQDKRLAEEYDKTTNDPEFFTTYNSNKEKLDQLMLDWEKLQEEYDQKSNF